MRDDLAKFGGLVALGLAAMCAGGCKQKVAPVAVQPVVRSAPNVSGPVPSDFPPDDPPVPDSNAMASRKPRTRRIVAPRVVQTPAVDVLAVEEAQRRRDAEL